jgi:hypothetical protein
MNSWWPAFLLFVILVFITISRLDLFKTIKKPKTTNQNIKPVITNSQTMEDQFSEKSDLKVSHDTIQSIVLEVNKAIQNKYGECTYIIETTELRKFKNKLTNRDLYVCTFMATTIGGFPRGISVTVKVSIEYDSNFGSGIFSVKDKSNEEEIDKLTIELGVLHDLADEFQNNPERLKNINNDKELLLRKLNKLTFKANKPIAKVNILEMNTYPIDIKPPDNSDLFSQASIQGNVYKDYENVKNSELTLLKSKFINSVNSLEVFNKFADSRSTIYKSNNES